MVECGCEIAAVWLVLKRDWVLAHVRSSNLHKEQVMKEKVGKASR
jgi:hypothetical protein